MAQRAHKRSGYAVLGTELKPTFLLGQFGRLLDPTAAKYQVVLIEDCRLSRSYRSLRLIKVHLHSPAV